MLFSIYFLQLGRDIDEDDLFLKDDIEQQDCEVSLHQFIIKLFTESSSPQDFGVEVVADFPELLLLN
jgi:hypothetical protein